jgi:FkbM family methyltransferase
MQFISYAQNCEDVMLWRALRHVEKGFYIDVGAADPNERSITRAFYERGWSGINIEPLDEYVDRLREARPRDINLRVAIGKEPGLRRLHPFPGTSLDTFNSGTRAERHRVGSVGDEIVVPVLTFGKILEDHGAPEIQFLKIEAEALEAEAFEGLDLVRVRPWIIVAQATKPDAPISTRDKWECIITGHRYGLAYFDGLNCFYVADEVSKLKEQLKAPPNVFDDFVRWSEWQAIDRVEALEKLLSAEQSKSAKISAAFQAEKNRAAELRSDLADLQTENGRLHNENSRLHRMCDSLAAGQGKTLAQLDNLSAQVQNVQTQLGFPWVDRAMGHAFETLHVTGNRVTGGGIRAASMRFAKAVLRSYVRFANLHPRLAVVPRVVLKPFPRLTSTLYRVAMPPVPDSATKVIAGASKKT